MWSHQLVLFDFGMVETHTGFAKGALTHEWITWDCVTAPSCITVFPHITVHGHGPICKTFPGAQLNVLITNQQDGLELYWVWDLQPCGADQLGSGNLLSHGRSGTAFTCTWSSWLETKHTLFMHYHFLTKPVGENRRPSRKPVSEISASSVNASDLLYEREIKWKGKCSRLSVHHRAWVCLFSSKTVMNRILRLMKDTWSLGPETSTRESLQCPVNGIAPNLKQYKNAIQTSIFCILLGDWDL